MPYISGEARRELANGDRGPLTTGELNFLISDLIDSYLMQEPVTYDRLNAVAGVLSLADFEIKRRIVAHYEDQKRAENGEVFFSVEGST